MDVTQEELDSIKSVIIQQRYLEQIEREAEYDDEGL